MKKALVLSLALVLGAGLFAFAQGAITGEWYTEITIDPAGADPAAFFDFSSTLDVTYSVGGWDFSSSTTVDDTGWATQSFAAGGAFGLFDITSGMVVSPLGDDADWPEWIFVDTSFTFGTVSIGLDFDLYARDIRLCLTGAATTGLVDITIEMCFGDLYIHPIYGFPVDQSVGYPYTWRTGYGKPPTATIDWAVYDNDLCDLDWMGVDITVAFPFCCADVTAALSISCDGFESICFDVAGIAIPNLPWVTIDAELCFEMESKTLVLTPKFDFGADVCFDLYICEYKNGGTGPLTELTLGNFYIEGIGLECEIGGVSFTGISYWGTQCASTLKPLALGNYWEMYEIATTEDACCGPFDFDVAVFFDKASTFLFDVAAFEANFSYELGANFVFSMGLEYTAASGLTEWTIGFDITW